MNKSNVKAESTTPSAKGKPAKKAVQSRLELSDETLDLYSEERTPEKQDTWVKWITTNSGNQYCILRILDWNTKLWVYDDRDWDSRPYHDTDMGKLAVSSVGLRRQLKPYLMQQYKGKLKVLRKGKGTDTIYTVTDLALFEEEDD